MPRRPASPKPSEPAASADAVAPVAAAKGVRRPARSKGTLQAADPAAERQAPVSGDSVPVSPSPHAVETPAPLRRRGTAKLSPAGALPPARIPRESLEAPRDRRLLLIAAAVSVAVHLTVLAIHFSPIVLKDWASGPPLEVALVNAKSKTKPTKADILAQAHLDGGGNTDLDRRARTPLPVMPKDSPVNDVQQSAKKVEALEQQAKEVMAQLKAAAPAPAPAPPVADSGDRADLPDAKELLQRTMEAIRLEAQIAKDLEAYQKRPKRRFVGARAEEYRFARYVEDWRLKIENVGNRNYPEAARQQHLYGNLILTVSIRSDGSLENVEVNRSSGHRILDAAAVKIVEMSAPFAVFPPDVKRDTDILTITRTWSFTKADELVSQ